MVKTLLTFWENLKERYFEWVVRFLWNLPTLRIFLKIKRVVTFWTDRDDPLHYWKLIIAGWAIAIVGFFPTLNMVRGESISWPFFMLIGFPAAAHLYGLFANVRALIDFKDHHRVGPALIGSCYFVASFIGENEIEFLPTLFLPLSGVIVAASTYGIAFTGFAPLFGMVLVYFLLWMRLSIIHLGAASVIMVSAWLLSMTTAYILGPI